MRLSTAPNSFISSLKAPLLFSSTPFFFHSQHHSTKSFDPWPYSSSSSSSSLILIQARSFSNQNVDPVEDRKVHGHLHHRTNKPLPHPPIANLPADQSKQHVVHHRQSHPSPSTHHQHGGAHGAKHQIAHRAKEKIGMKLAEKIATKALPRLLKVKKRVGLKLLARKLTRGVAIALPAVGGVFAAFVTASDVRRALNERKLGNVTASICFATAAIFDVIDLGAHIVTALSMSEYIDHHIMHTSEEVSLFAAVAATVAAIVGEFNVKEVVVKEEGSEVKAQEEAKEGE